MSDNSNQTPALVAGKWVTTEESISVYNPAAKNDVVGSVPRLTQDQVMNALASAQEGARVWGNTGILERGQVLLNTARLLRERSEEIARLIVSENGKTIAEATGEVEKSAQFFEYYGGMGRDKTGYLLADGRPGTRAEVRYEPVGTVFVITPWNDPLLTPARKIAPALLTGNAVLMKPASETPLTAIALAHALVDAGLPLETFSTVTGRGAEVVDPVLEQPALIDAVSFTGSTDIGLRVQGKIAGQNIRVQTEMGGKNASVVLADADLDLAVQTIIAGGFGQTGQRCTATSRVLVQTSIADEFNRKLSSAVSELKVGPGLESTTQVGPLISQSARDSVQGFIDRAQADGGKVLSSASLSDDLSDSGHFVSPTIVGDVRFDSELWRDEVFGPVIAVTTFDSLDQAIDEVNKSDYGLSAAIFTQDLTSAYTFTDNAHTGQVSVNLPTSGWDIHHPFGGYKLSGSGYKEQGTETLNFYTRVKTVAIRIGS